MPETCLWTAAEIRSATLGKGGADLIARGVSIDSRTAVFGDVFIALRGAKTDGHGYVAGAFKKGATMAIVDTPPKGVDPDDKRLIYVADTKKALYDLAAFARKRTKATIIAIAGTAGKTSLKECLVPALEPMGKAHANAKSLNNHIGVPLSLCRMPAHALNGVFEIGSSHPGDLEPLVKLVNPHHGIITNVSASHFEGFETMEALLAEKAVLAAHVQKDGCVFIDADCPSYEDLTNLLLRRKELKIKAISNALEQAYCHAKNIKHHDDCSCFAAKVGSQNMLVKIGVGGDHWVKNALFVLAVCQTIKADLGRAGLALAHMKSVIGRGRKHKIPVWDGHCTLIDESYNANPLTMRLAIKHLGKAKLRFTEARRVAVLGAMHDLGDLSYEAHRDLVKTIKDNKIDKVFAIGEDMIKACEKLPDGVLAGNYQTIEALYEDLRNKVVAGDVVLVKGSHDVNLSSLVSLIVNKPFGRYAHGQTVDMNQGLARESER